VGILHAVNELFGIAPVSAGYGVAAPLPSMSVPARMTMRAAVWANAAPASARKRATRKSMLSIVSKEDRKQ
jgi:hypothetical protein